jgi:hypothetical protein
MEARKLGRVGVGLSSGLSSYTIFFMLALCFYLLMEARKLGRVGVGLSSGLSP